MLAHKLLHAFAAASLRILQNSILGKQLLCDDGGSEVKLCELGFLAISRRHHVCTFSATLPTLCVEWPLRQLVKIQLLT